MRRRLIAALTLLAACASAGPPPGGPEDRAAPRLVRVSPDSNATSVDARNAVFFFDETINDRGTGTTDLESMFLVSPSDGTPRVSWHRSRIEVRPRRGFRANTAYTVTLLPGLADLRGNVMRSGASVVFSTGATIPTGRINGIVFDWVSEQPAARAIVEAVTADSVVYVAQADSSGRFAVGPLDPGSYLVRATIDQNQNRRADRGESWDTLRVAALPATPIELLAAARDTLPARVVTAAFADSVTIRVTFDRLLDPTQRLATTSFRLAGADSVAIPVTTVQTPTEEAAAARRREQQAADSARRADSVAGRPRPPLPAGPPSRADSSQKPSRPAPFTTVSLVLGRPLASGTTYRLRVTGVRGLSGREAESERTFTTPRPAPPRPAPTDTTRRGAAPPPRQ